VGFSLFFASCSAIISLAITSSGDIFSSPNSMIAMINGESNKIDSALTMFSQFEIIETVRTGKVVMARGEQAT